VSSARLRFHLDEMVDSDIALALRRLGIDVTTTPEAGLRTQPDAEQLAYVVREQRVIVTHDADYLRIAQAGEAHAGIAYCALLARTIGQIVERLVELCERLTPSEMNDRVEYR